MTGSTISSISAAIIAPPASIEPPGPKPSKPGPRSPAWPLGHKPSCDRPSCALSRPEPIKLTVPPSTSSAAGCPTLFAGFAGTISESDFFAPFIIGDGLRPSRCGPGAASQGGDKEIPVPAHEVYVHAEGLKTTRGGEGPCDGGPAPVAFCLPRRHRHPGLHCFRRSIPRLYAPLSTLRGRPRGSVPRMTRGQRGSLLLHRDGLAPSTSCRSPGAPRLNGWPARSPADASPLASRPDTHGSGPTWIATPSSYRTLTDYSWPVSRRTTKSH